MRRTLSKMHTTKFNEFDKDSDFSNVPSHEADICLNCPFPDCKKAKCEYLESKKKELGIGIKKLVRA